MDADTAGASPRRPLRAVRSAEVTRRHRERVMVQIRRQRRDARLALKRKVLSSAASGAAAASGAGPIAGHIVSADAVDDEDEGDEEDKGSETDAPVDNPEAVKLIFDAGRILLGEDRTQYLRALEQLLSQTNPRLSFIRNVARQDGLLQRITGIIHPESGCSPAARELAARVALTFSYGKSMQCFALAANGGLDAILACLNAFEGPPAERPGDTSLLLTVILVVGNLSVACQSITQSLVEKGIVHTCVRLWRAGDDERVRHLLPWMVQGACAAPLPADMANALARVLADSICSLSSRVDEALATVEVFSQAHADAVAFSGVLRRLATLSCSLSVGPPDKPLGALLNVARTSDVHAQAVCLSSLEHVHTLLAGGKPPALRVVAAEILVEVARGPAEQKQLLLTDALWESTTRPLRARADSSALRSSCAALLSHLCDGCSLDQVRWMVDPLRRRPLLPTAAAALEGLTAPSDLADLLRGLRFALPLARMLWEDAGQSFLAAAEDAGLAGVLERLAAHEHRDVSAIADAVYEHNFGGEADMHLGLSDSWGLEEDEEEEEDEEAEEDKEERGGGGANGGGGGGGGGAVGTAWTLPRGGGAQAGTIWDGAAGTGAAPAAPEVAAAGTLFAFPVAAQGAGFSGFG